MSQKSRNYYGFLCPHCSEPIALIEAEVVTEGRVRQSGRFPDAIHLSALREVRGLGRSRNTAI